MRSLTGLLATLAALALALALPLAHSTLTATTTTPAPAECGSGTQGCQTLTSSGMTCCGDDQAHPESW